MNNNILKYLVPVVAIIVLVESVMVISNLKTKATVSKVVDNNTSEVVEASPTLTETPAAVMADSVYQINMTENQGKVNVAMMGNSDRALDSVNVYVKYDPMMVEVSNLTFDKKLPAPTFNKISTTRGLVVANFLVAEATGLKLKAGESLSLMNFDIKPLKSGKVEFEISTGSELKESATMIVENGTSKALPFSSNKLTVNASL